MAIVTVDFDGTLFKGNSFQVMFQAAKKDFTWKEWNIVGMGVLKATGMGLVKGKESFKNGFFKGFARSFKGKSKNELDAFFEELIRVGRAQVNEDLVDCIRKHQEQGDTVIVLSGAFHPFLKAFTAAVGLDVPIISTKLQFDNTGLCTGEVNQLVTGDVKVEKVKQWLNGIAPNKDKSHKPKTWAYADSMSDVPLLYFVDNPIVVNPKKEMVEMAEQHAWPIFPERSQA